MSNIDQSIFAFLNSFTNHNGFADWLFAFFARDLIYILILLVPILIWRYERSRGGRVYFTLLTLLSLTFSEIILIFFRYFYNNPRPFDAIEGLEPIISHVSTPSFPSGHMMFLIPLALVIYYLRPKIGVWFIVGTLVMGISRVIVGVHWPLDILGGFILDGIAFYAAKFVLEKRIKRSSPISAPENNPI